ncbi:hypothetical protein U1707_10155 [Sphingomonas sp. PB2P12]|uniref:hypothetical protein n=1 Tax=Sphingomonas sandaracina TaxID=3096157 RepID=UPI002FC59E82
MRIEITSPFIDKQAIDPENADVAVGTKMTVTAERGAELVNLRLATEIETPAKPARPARKAPKARTESARAAPVQKPADPIDQAKTSLPPVSASTQGEVQQ